MSGDKKRPLLGRARPARDDEETREIKTGGGDALTAAQAEADTRGIKIDVSKLEIPKRIPAAIITAREKRLEEIRDLLEREGGYTAEAAEVWEWYIEELESELMIARASHAMVAEIEGSEVGSDPEGKS